jgi:hypothetical protein
VFSCILALTALTLTILPLTTLPAMAQVGQPVPGLPQTTPPAQAPAPPPPPPAKNVPDYPEPRTLTFGAFYWFTGPGTDPGIFGGAQATTYSTLTDLGRPHKSPGFELFFPISRTGEIHVEVMRTSGLGNQTAPANTTIFTTPFDQGDYLATNYRISQGKAYLDDLLFPHKFPVSKFRLKSLWEFSYTSIRASVDNPIQEAEGTSAGAGQGTRNIYYPEFGIAAEYALTPHVLLRTSVAGFAIPGHAVLGDGDATIGYRHGFLELRGGVKFLHYKTSPKTDDYLKGTLTGAFVDLRIHYAL